MNRRQNPFRVVLGALRTLVQIVLLPLFFLWVLFKERARERELASRTAPVIDAESALDEKALARAIEESHDAIWVIPIAELFRVVAAQSGAKAGARLSKYQDRYMVMNHVPFPYNLTSPVDGERLPPAELSDGRVVEFPNVRLVPNGFVTDFASIPVFLRPIVGHPMGYYNRAAIVHDWAYSHHGDDSAKGREVCDLAMLKLMAQDRTEPWRRALIYVGLRIGGGVAYRTSPRRSAELQTLVSGPEIQASTIRAFSNMLTFLSRQMALCGQIHEERTGQILADMAEAAARGQGPLPESARERN